MNCGCAGSQMSLDRRLARLEQNSLLGNDEDLLFMRVPPDYQVDPQFQKSQALASKTDKGIMYLESATARALPFWKLLPLDSLTDELLDELVSELENRIAAIDHNEAAQSQTGNNANG
jgi:hypothetical protein